MELPSGLPISAIRNPPLYKDTVGNEGLSGGTPLRFGGRWDVVSEKVEQYQDPNKPQKVVKKGPHDCYCDVGYNCWSMAGCAPAHHVFMPRALATESLFLAVPMPARSKARTTNFGLRGVFEREFWTNTPGELALVWDTKGVM